MVNNELITLEKTDIVFTTPPDIVLQNAMVAAKVLKDVISKKNKPVIFNGEQYLEYEDWQTVGQFYGYGVITRDAMPVEIDGVKGAKAHADLINLKTNEVSGGADAFCLRDEPNWEKKPWFQLASMAQTRAGSKAFSNRLRWVVVLAGYKGTPAEEMTEGTIQEPVDTTTHYCQTHKTPFFMRGKMKSFAHPIAETKEWCYEPSEKREPAPEIKQAMAEAANNADKTASNAPEQRQDGQGAALTPEKVVSDQQQGGTIPAAVIVNFPVGEKPQAPAHKICKSYGDLLNACWTELHLSKAAVLKASGKAEGQMLETGVDYEAIYQQIKAGIA